MKIVRIVCLLFLGVSAFAQSKQFKCLVVTSDGVKGRDVPVVTKTETILNKLHQVGTAEIGRYAGSTFWISWDATEPSVSIGRKDTDGFEMSASSDGGSVIILIARRPNEPETRTFCSAQ